MAVAFVSLLFNIIFGYQFFFFFKINAIFIANKKLLVQLYFLKDGFSVCWTKNQLQNLMGIDKPCLSDFLPILWEPPLEQSREVKSSSECPKPVINAQFSAYSWHSIRCLHSYAIKKRKKNQYNILQLQPSGCGSKSCHQSKRKKKKNSPSFIG